MTARFLSTLLPLLLFGFIRCEGHAQAAGVECPAGIRATLRDRFLGGLITKGAFPEDIELASLNLKRFDSSDASALRNGESIRYVIDQDNRVWTTSSESPFTQESLWLAADGSNPDAQGTLLVKEAGTISMMSGGPKRAKLELKPDYGIGLSDEEVAKVEGSVRKETRGLPLKRDTQIEAAKSKFIKCTEILNKQSKGSNFIRDRLLADNMVATSVIMSSELMGAGRLKSDRGRDVVMADLIGANLSSLAAGYTGRFLILNGIGDARALGVRLAVGGGMIAVQNGIYREVLRDDSSTRANAISLFDTAYFVTRIPINQAVDKALLRKIPSIAFNACLKDSKAQFFISPTMVRIYERYGWAMIYYGLRKTVIDE